MRTLQTQNFILKRSLHSIVVHSLEQKEQAVGGEIILHVHVNFFSCNFFAAEIICHLSTF
jgi:hypothetical protein